MAEMNGTPTLVPDRYRLLKRFGRGLRSPTLRDVVRQFRARTSRSTTKELGRAVLVAVIAFLVTHNALGASIEIAILFAIVIGAAAFFSLLVLAVDALDQRLATQGRTLEILTQKIGAHCAIHEWVRSCEISRSDPGRNHIIGDVDARDLESLEWNVINSLENYPFYEGHVVRVKEIAAGESNEPAAKRLERLLTYLQEQLRAGSYIR